MERLSIIPGGLSSEVTYEDGAADMQCNLRRKGGALRPVLQAGNAADGQLRNREYSLLYECHFDDDKDIIGVYESNGNSTVYLIFRQEAGGEWQMHRNPLGGCNGKVTGIHQTGRILAVVTQDSLYYLIRKDGDYTWLGTLPELPPITFSCTDMWGKDDTENFDTLRESVSEETIHDRIKGLVNELKEELRKDHEGLVLFDAHLVRWAFRLYDGSLSKPSAPILLLPSYGVISGINPGEGGETDSFRGILAANYMSYSYEQTSDDNIRYTIHPYVRAYKVRMSYDFTRLSSSSDVIRSVDLFMSPAIGLADIENIRNSFFIRDGDYMGGLFPLVCTEKNGLKPELVKRIEETSTFYFMRSIPLEAGNNVIFPDVSLDSISTMENLIMQEQMADEGLSHHTEGGSTSYQYNGMLHMGNIKTKSFDGFSAQFFNWGGEDYNGYKSEGRATKDLLEIWIKVELDINGEKKSVWSKTSYAEVTALFASSLLSYPDERAISMTFYGRKNPSPVTPPGFPEGGEIGPIQIVEWYKAEKTLTLKRHPFLNLAYYFDENLKPIWFYFYDWMNEDEVEQMQTSASTPAIAHDPNKIKASATDNPLLFPAAHTYTAGNGTILALQSNAMDVSARNFGTYPVYVFATDGIYLMQVGDGETAYSAITPLASTEYPTSGVVCVTPAGVAFVGSRGLCMVSAGGVQQLTPMVELPWPEVQLEWDGRFPAGLRRPSAGKKAFNDYLKGISRLLYNPHENELIVSSDGETYDYVLQLGSGLLWENTEKAGVPVENHYPELWTMEVTNKAMKYIKDWSLYQDGSSREVAFLTRPMRLGTDDVKRLARMVVRGTLYGVSATEDDKRPTVCLWMSNDGVHFKLLRGLFYKDLSRRDMDLGMLARSKGRYFVLGFCLSVTGDTEIRMIEAEAEKQYNNLKMR